MRRLFSLQVYNHAATPTPRKPKVKLPLLPAVQAEEGRCHKSRRPPQSPHACPTARDFAEESLKFDRRQHFACENAAKRHCAHCLSAYDNAIGLRLQFCGGATTAYASANVCKHKKVRGKTSDVTLRLLSPSVTHALCCNKRLTRSYLPRFILISATTTAGTTATARSNAICPKCQPPRKPNSREDSAQ